MKRIEEIYREILYQAIENKKLKSTQLELSKRLNLSLSMVNLAFKPLKRMNAIKVNPRNYEIISTKKILLYWASMRNLEKDIIYKTRIDADASEIEKRMSANIVFTAFSGYKFMFNEVPADYSEVYVYGDLEAKERFKGKEGNPNLFILKKDKTFDLYKKLTIAQLFVDLWNLNQWYAKDFLKAMEEKLNGILA